MKFDENADLLPRFTVPDGHTEESWLRAEVERGLEFRLPGRGSRRRIGERAAYELGVMAQMGFPGYFLVVADLVPARPRVRHPGRPGSRVGRPAR